MNEAGPPAPNGHEKPEGAAGPSPVLAYSAQAIAGCGQIVAQALDVLRASDAPADDQEVCRVALEATAQAALAALDLLRKYAASKDSGA